MKLTDVVQGPVQSGVLTPATLRLCGTSESWFESVIVTAAPDFTVTLDGENWMFLAVTTGELFTDGAVVAVGGGGGTGVEVGGGGGGGSVALGSGGTGVSVGGTSVGGTSVGGSGVLVGGALVAVAAAGATVVCWTTAVTLEPAVALTLGVGELSEIVEVGVVLVLLLPPQATSSPAIIPAHNATGSFKAALPCLSLVGQLRCPA